MGSGAIPLSILFFFLPIINLNSLRLGPLGAVLGTAALAIFHAQGILGAPDNMITDPGEILDPAAADQHHRMFLQIVAYAGNIGGYFGPV
jgi:hypothetical protein